MSAQTEKNTQTSKSDKQSVGQTLSLNRIFLIIAIILVLVGGLIGYFMYMPNVEIKMAPQAITQNNELTLYGTLMFTAAVDNVLGIYALSLGTEEKIIKKFETPTLVASTEFTDKYNPTKLYFSASTIYTVEESDQVGLHSWELSNNTFKHYESVVGSLERDINYSQSTGMIAFSRLKGSIDVTSLPYQIEDYEIVIMDPAQDKVTEIIEGGIYPRWSPTGETLLYVANDGLYELDLNTTRRSKVIGPNELDVVVTPSTAIDVSSDGMRVVLTSQGTGSITVFDVHSWSPLTLQVNTKIVDPLKFYFNPVISPDGRMYAVVATDKINGTFSNPRIEVRAIRDNQVLLTKSLKGFDPEKSYIDDWVAGEIVFSEDGEI